MLENLKNYEIILGSNSPRRKELLSGLDIDFQIISNDTDEAYPDNLVCEEIPVYLATKKAESYLLKENQLLITADTIVWFNNQVFGKPANRVEAENILRTLSGNKHQVITGV